MNAMLLRVSSVSEPVSPAIDAVQALWAKRELEAIVDQVGDDSPVAMVLRHAQRELESLMHVEEAATIIGPFRVAA